MKKIILPFIFLNFGLSTIFAQYETVEFNYEKSVFNNGQPLPAETYIELQGDISRLVSRVEVAIYSENGFPERKPLYEKAWKRPFNSNEPRFAIPLNYYLRASDEYDVVIGYFRRASAQEISNLRQELYNSLDSYIDQSLDFERKKIELLKDERRMIEDMNSIVNSSLKYYRSPLNSEFQGFSDLVQSSIERVEDDRQKKFLGKKSSQQENLQQKRELVNDLKTRVHSEVSYLLNQGLSVLGDVKHVDDYRTESLGTTFTLHGGYGGAYFNKAADNQEDYGTSWMAGITLPLGKKEFASPFWSNTALMAGVFFQNFDREEGVEATGPFIGRPYYLGVGYSFYRFLRISAGGVLLENEGARTNGSIPNDKIYVQPFIGLTVDIDLKIGLGK